MLKSPIRIATAALLAVFASAAGAAPTAYVFDTVTRFDLGATRVSIQGILRNDTTATTVTIPDQTNIDGSVPMTRCVPVFLTMMEKPGRYYLNLTIEPNDGVRAIINCGLELRS
jgi:hypothetical protein